MHEVNLPPTRHSLPSIIICCLLSHFKWHTWHFGRLDSSLSHLFSQGPLHQVNWLQHLTPKGSHVDRELEQDTVIPYKLDHGMMPMATLKTSLPVYKNRMFTKINLEATIFFIWLKSMPWWLSREKRAVVNRHRFHNICMRQDGRKAIALLGVHNREELQLHLLQREWLKKCKCLWVKK